MATVELTPKDVKALKALAAMQDVLEKALEWKRSFRHGRDITDEGYSVADEKAEAALYEAVEAYEEAAKREATP